jgi:hypothetical protein
VGVQEEMLRRNKVRFDDHGSTITGVPMTVHSLGDGNISRRDIPREVNLLDTGQMTLPYTLGSNGKLFKICNIPTQYKGFSS